MPCSPAAETERIGHGTHKTLFTFDLGGSARTVFVGDDDMDEDVFRMKNERILGIRIGNGSSSDDDFFPKDQKGIARLLDEIISALSI